nr:MAG TPA: hypothetical protein [Caudoviricetes sp.]
MCDILCDVLIRSTHYINRKKHVLESLEHGRFAF